MKIGVLGTGMVGQTLGTKLVQLGHDVMMGSRQEAHPNAVSWAREAGHQALYGTFYNAAAFGEIIFNCTLGSASLEALHAAGAENLKNKILVDTSNPLDYSNELWTLTVCNSDSLGEQIQRAFPETFVVKTLNTMNFNVMLDSSKLQESTDVFVSGNSAEARATVAAMLRNWFGWREVIDLGGISTSRGVEMYVVLWQNLRQAISSRRFNIKVVGE
jgi:8-hydroxy-5-deazaflavin:NADPH oxidoreductase